MYFSKKKLLTDSLSNRKHFWHSLFKSCYIYYHFMLELYLDFKQQKQNEDDGWRVMEILKNCWVIESKLIKFKETEEFLKAKRS